MNGRRKTHWFDLNETPQGGWSNVGFDSRWEDPTFEDVCENMESPVDKHRGGQALSEGLRHLTDKQAFVIDRIWGLTDGQPYSFRQVAAAMGVDESTVREHFRAGMSKLTKVVPPQLDRSSAKRTNEEE